MRMRRTLRFRLSFCDTACAGYVHTPNRHPLMQTQRTHTSAIFRTWLAFGLAVNLAFTSNSEPTLFGPAWLWLIAIPLTAYALMNLPAALQILLRSAQRGWQLRHRPQAIRVRR